GSTGGIATAVATRVALDRRVAPVARELVVEIYDALVLGTRDYVRKNGFDSAGLGLFGGGDSGLCAGIAAVAARPKHTGGGGMPRGGGGRAAPIPVGGPGGGRGGARPRPRHPLLQPVDPGGLPELSERAGAPLQRTPRRYHRGKPPGPHPRELPDGALQQV